MKKLQPPKRPVQQEIVIKPIDEVGGPILRALNRCLSDAYRKSFDLGAISDDFGSAKNDRLDKLVEFEMQSQEHLHMLVFQLMQLTIVYTITDLNYQFLPYSKLAAQKDMLISLVQTLKTYINQRTNSQNIFVHLKRMVSNQYKQHNKTQGNESDNEGFYSEEEAPEDNKIAEPGLLIPNKIRKKLEQDSILYEMLNKLNERDNLIRELETKVAKRDQIISDTMEAHVKDIRHLREVIYRKNKGVDDFEFFEVNYFDAAEVMDPKVRQMLDTKILALKNTFEQQHREALTKLILMHNENDQLKEKIKHLQKVISQEFTLDKLLQKVFYVEPNPYRVWKGIQDIKGGLYFFEVFENQRPSEGINYRQVNKMLMSSKAYEREYLIYKRQIDDQVQKFISNQQNDSIHLMIQLEDQQRKLQAVEQGMLLKIDDVKRTYEQQIHNLNQQNLQCMNKSQISVQLKAIDTKGNETHRLDCEIARYMLKRWALIGHFHRILDHPADKKVLKKFVLQTRLVNELKTYYTRRETRFYDIFADTQTNHQSLEIEVQELQAKATLLEANIANQRVENEKLLKHLNQSEAEKLEFKNLKLVYEQAYKSILKQIDQNLLGIKPQDLNLEGQSEIAQDFKVKAKQLGRTQKRTVKEAIETTQNIIRASDTLYKSSTAPQRKTVGVLTIICNINTKFAGDYEGLINKLKHRRPQQLLEKDTLQINIEDLNVQDLSSEDENIPRNYLPIKLYTRATQTQFDAQRIPASNAISQKWSQAITEIARSHNQQSPNNLNAIRTDRASIINPFRTLDDLEQSDVYNPEGLPKPQEEFKLKTYGKPVEKGQLKKRVRLQSITVNLIDQSKQSTEEGQPIVFQRLFEDSERKQKRQKEFKEKIQEVERMHWEEILSLLHHMQSSDPKKIQERLQNSMKFYSEQIGKSLDTWAYSYKTGSPRSTQKAIRNTPQVAELQISTARNSPNPSRSGKQHTQTELPDFMFSSIIETMQMKRRVFINELMDEFNRNTLRIKKIDQDLSPQVIYNTHQQASPDVNVKKSFHFTAHRKGHSVLSRM